MSLTTRRRMFVEYYLGPANANATEAARMAGYAAPEQEGHRLTQLPEIRSLIEVRVETTAMTADQVLALLAELAQATMADFVSFVPQGQANAGQPYIDLKKASERHKLHLIRKLVSNRDGRVEVELYDAQAALVHLGRRYKLFTDRIETTQTGPITIEYVNDWREAATGR